MKTPRTVYRRLRQLSLRPCSLPGCEAPAWRFSRFCRRHRRKEEETGHPAGYTVTDRQLEPYRKLAADYLTRYAEHEAVKAGIEWMRGFLREADAQAPLKARRGSNTRSRAMTRIAAVHRRGVTPDAALATLIGLYAMRLEQPTAFLGERHFQHQVGHRFCRLAKAPIRASEAKSPTECPATVTPQTRLMIFRWFDQAIGPYLRRAAEAALALHQLQIQSPPRKGSD